MFDIPPPFQLHHLLCSLPSLPNDRTTPSLPLPGPTWSQPPLPPISKLSHWMQNQHSRLLGVPRHANNSPFWYSPSPQNTSGPDKLPLPSISLAPRQSGIVGLLWNQKIVKTGKAIIATANVGFKIPKLPNLMPLSSSTAPSSSTPPSSSPSSPSDGRIFVPNLKERRSVLLHICVLVPIADLVCVSCRQAIAAHGAFTPASTPKSVTSTFRIRAFPERHFLSVSLYILPPTDSLRLLFTIFPSFASAFLRSYRTAKITTWKLIIVIVPRKESPPFRTVKRAGWSM